MRAHTYMNMQAFAIYDGTMLSKVGGELLYTGKVAVDIDDKAKGEYQFAWQQRINEGEFHLCIGVTTASKVCTTTNDLLGATVTLKV